MRTEIIVSSLVHLTPEPCGCEIVGTGAAGDPLRICYCTTHGAAPKLQAALATASCGVMDPAARRSAKAALAEAEGRTP